MNTQEAHVHSSKHREEILKSNQCGCFYCLKTFKPEEIKDWIDEEQTALCPFCNIDSVIGDNSGAAIDETFLKEMHKDWFDSTQTIRGTKALAEIGVGIAEGRIFCSAQIPPNQQEDMLRMVFMPLAFMKPSDRAKMIDRQVAVLFEEVKEAAPMGVNGFPVFMSFQTLNNEEWTIVLSKIKEYDEMKKKLLGE